MFFVRLRDVKSLGFLQGGNQGNEVAEFARTVLLDEGEKVTKVREWSGVLPWSSFKFPTSGLMARIFVSK